MFWLYQSRWWNALVRSVVALAVLLYVWVVYQVQDALILTVRHTHRWAVAFGLVQTVLLGVGISSIAIVKFFRERHQAVRAVRIARIRQLLAAYAAGQDKPSDELIGCFRRWPRDFITVLSEAVHRVRGNALTQLQHLAWRPEVCSRAFHESSRRNPRRVAAAINILSQLPVAYAQKRIIALAADPRNTVRLQARRMLIRYGSQRSQLDLLRKLATMASWERIQLVQQLSRNAAVAPAFLRESLTSHDNQTVLAALDLVLGLQRFFGVSCPAHLVDDPDLEIRIRFFKALPFLAAPGEAAPLIRRGLRDSDWRVRSMAARAAGVLRLRHLGDDLLAVCTASTHGAEAGHAARALAALGGESWDRLRRVITTGGVSGWQVADVIQKQTMAKAAGVVR